MDDEVTSVSGTIANMECGRSNIHGNLSIWNAFSRLASLDVSGLPCTLSVTSSLELETAHSVSHDPVTTTAGVDIDRQILKKQINELKKQNSELRELVRESVVQTSLDLAQDVGEAAAPEVERGAYCLIRKV